MAGFLVLLLGVWIVFQGVNGNAGRLTTGQIGLSGGTAPTSSPGSSTPPPVAAGSGGNLVP